MAVTAAFGMTESGKTYHIQKAYLEKSAKTIVFDPPGSKEFNSYDKINLNKASDMAKLFRKYAKRKNYKLVLRPGRNSNDTLLCDRLIILACALGRVMGKGCDPKDRVKLLVDEADVVCSSHYQSDRIKHVVNKGRHDNVDSFFIARNPHRLHTDIRANASKIISFQLANIPKDFRDNFGPDAAKIRNLGFRCRFEWDHTGKMAIYDQDNKETWRFESGKDIGV